MKKLSKKRQLFFISSLCVTISVIVAFMLLLTHEKPGFTLSKIRSPFTVDEKWILEEPTLQEKEKIHTILSQRFNYLGSGAQCYAFISDDGKYVLKFFKMKHLVPKTWLKYIPVPGLEQYRFRKIDRHIIKHENLFSSYKMAYEELKKETGLIYIHLNKTKNLHQSIELFDKQRNTYRINLDDFEFVLQERALLVRDHIRALMQKGDVEGAAASLRALLDQVVIQAKKGFVDRDSGISHNYGFVKERIVHFDVGRIMRDETADDASHYQREVLRVGKKLEQWLEVHYPTLLPYLEESIDRLINPT